MIGKSIFCVVILISLYNAPSVLIVINYKLYDMRYLAVFYKKWRYIISRIYSENIFNFNETVTVLYENHLGLGLAMTFIEIIDELIVSMANRKYT